jgi:hypothetical protein
MQYFQTDRAALLNELEKSFLSSYQLVEFENASNVLLSKKYLSRSSRDIFSRLLTLIYRIDSLYFGKTDDPDTIDLIDRLNASINSNVSNILKKDCNFIKEKLIYLRSQLSQMESGIAPAVQIYDKTSNSILPQLKKSLRLAGAKSICAVPTENNQNYGLYIIGTVEEGEFLSRLKELSTTENFQIPATITYEQSFENISEQVAIVTLGGSTHGGHLENCGEIGSTYGYVGKGTIGCIIGLKEEKLQGTQQRVSTESSILFGNLEDESGPSSSSDALKLAIQNGYKPCVVTAAHVKYSNLEMTSEKEDLIAKFNQDALAAGMYTQDVDIALFFLPTENVTFVADSPIKRLKFDSEFEEWNPAQLQPNTPVLKFGKTTGITTSTYIGIGTTVDKNNGGAEYTDCVMIKHPSKISRFCEPGDSGAIYFAQVFDKHNNAVWLPFAIHRTSDDIASYGSVLSTALRALREKKKVIFTDAKFFPCTALEDFTYKAIAEKRLADKNIFNNNMNDDNSDDKNNDACVHEDNTEGEFENVNVFCVLALYGSALMVFIFCSTYM